MNCTKTYFQKKIEEFKHDDNIMKKILKYAHSKKQYIYPYFGVYDFESIADYQNKQKGENTLLLNKQVPISFSFGTNFDNEIKHEVNNNTFDLIKCLVQYFYKAQKESNEKIMTEYYDYIHLYCTKRLNMTITDTKQSDNVEYIEILKKFKI